VPADFLEGGEPPKAATGLALALALAPLDEDDEDVDSVMRVRAAPPCPGPARRRACDNRGLAGPPRLILPWPAPRQCHKVAHHRSCSGVVRA